MPSTSLGIEGTSKHYSEDAELLPEPLLAHAGLLQEKENANLLNYRNLANEIERISFKKQPEEEEFKNSDAPVYYSSAKKLTFYFFLGFSLIQDGLGSFLSIQTLISLIQGISSPISLAICSFFTLVSMALFYSFEAGMLKKMFGVEAFIDEAKGIIDIIDQQIEEVKKINELIVSVDVANKLTSFEYQNLVAQVVKINQELAAKKGKLEYPESKARKALQWGISTFGAIMVVAGAIFETKAFLLLLCASLVGTPTGWAIIGIAAISSLVLFCAMRGKGMASLMNPDLHKFQTVKDKLDSFKEKSMQSFQPAINHKKFLEHKLTEQVSQPASVSPFSRNGSCLQPSSLFKRKRSHSQGDLSINPDIQPAVAAKPM